MPKLKELLVPLLLVPLLTACAADKLQIPTIATGKSPLVCAEWKSGPHVSFASKHDTPETVASARILNHWMDGNNARREAYCAVK